MNCRYCSEPILEGEADQKYIPEMHYECVTRMVIGSVAHLLRKCGCYVEGSTESDPPEVTKREAALMAVDIAKRTLWHTDDLDWGPPKEVV